MASIIKALPIFLILETGDSGDGDRYIGIPTFSVFVSPLQRAHDLFIVLEHSPWKSDKRKRPSGRNDDVWPAFSRRHPSPRPACLTCSHTVII